VNKRSAKIYMSGISHRQHAACTAIPDNAVLSAFSAIEELLVLLIYRTCISSSLYNSRQIIANIRTQERHHYYKCWL